MSIKTIEIDEERLSNLEKTQKLLNEIWNDPEKGLVVKKAWKEKFPQAVIPEVDIATAQEKAAKALEEKVASENKELRDRLERFEKEQAERDKAAKEARENAAFEAEMQTAKKKYNLTAEGMQKVIDRMKEKNNPDVEAAAAWVTDHEPKVAPATTSSFAPSEMDLYGSSSGSDEWADLNKSPTKYFDKTVTSMLNDFANGEFGKYKEFGGNL